MLSLNRKKSGLTLIETIIGFSILIIVVVIAGLFSGNVTQFGNFFKKSFETAEEVQSTFQTIIPEIRSMGPSNTGTFPIETAATSSIAFYSDIDEDGLYERVRYFLNGTTLKKAVLKPTGSPLSYNPANEVLEDIIHNVALVSSSIFSYYDSSFTGSEPPMAPPPNIANIKVIEIKITAQAGNEGGPQALSVKIAPRNLKSN